MTLRLGLVGFGKMGQAMVQAWQDKNLISSIDILDPNISSSAVTNIKNAKHFSDQGEFLSHAPQWDVLILAVKPQTLDDLFGVAPTLPAHLLVVSILAGKTIADLAQKFGSAQPVVRTMPNTPAAIGKGMSVAISNKFVNDAQRDMVRDMMSPLGVFSWTGNEDNMDAITALSGSGPAYVFYMIECLAKAGVNAGLEPDFAMTLARQTVIGAAALAEVEHATPVDVLRSNVTSPNGTTAAGLAVLMDGKFQDIVAKTIARAMARSKELSSS